MRRALLLLALACATLSASYCGDGVFDGGNEQCDSGMRCVSLDYTLPWAGVGPSLGDRHVVVDFRYAVQDYNQGDAPMPVYGMRVQAGSAPAQAPLRCEYELGCTDEPGAKMALVLQPAGGAPLDHALAVVAAWTYDNYTCAQFMGAPATTVNAELAARSVELVVQWTGTVPDNVWLLGAISQQLAPNSQCGTACCTGGCKRTWAGLENQECTSSGAPSNASALGLPYYCVLEGQCVPFQHVVAANAYIPQCGNGILEPGEECDAGILGTTNGCTLYENFGWTNPLMADRFDWIQPRYKMGPEDIERPFMEVQGAFFLPYMPINMYYAIQTDPPTSQAIAFEAPPSYYVWRCELVSPGLIQMHVTRANVTGALAADVKIVYQADPSTNCSNWLEPFRALLYDHTDVLIYNSTASSFATTTSIQCDILIGNTFAYSTECCNAAVCQIQTPPTRGILCPSGQPVFDPPNSGWQCDGAGNCLAFVPSFTPSPSESPTRTASPTPTSLPSASSSATATLAASPSASSSITPSPSPSSGATQSPSASTGASSSTTSTASASPTGTRTPSPSASASATAPATQTPSLSTGATPSTTNTATAPPTGTSTQTAAPTGTPSGTRTASPSASVGASPSETPSAPATPRPDQRDTAAIFGAVFGTMGGVIALLVGVAIAFMSYKAYITAPRVPVPPMQPLRANLADAAGAEQWAY